jgi:hypothetical protein
VFIVGNNTLSEKFDYTTNLLITSTENVENYYVYINGDYYGMNVNEIQINTGDLFKIEIEKTNNLLESLVNIDSPLLY